MPLWGKQDLANNAPKSDVISHQSSANGQVAFDNVQVGAFVAGQAVGLFGVSATEIANTQGEGPHVTHAGWVKRTAGTGPVQSIAIVAGGSGYTNGFITISGGGVSNVAANASYTVNSVSGVITTVALVSGGSLYDSTAIATVANATSQATFSVTMGGRANRKSYETLVALRSMGADAGADDTAFPGA